MQHDMQTNELTREGARVLAVCNACRYCEQYCPAFPGDGATPDFRDGRPELSRHSCHGCGECLYVCQYAPPHEFAINVPQTFAQFARAVVRTVCVAGRARRGVSLPGRDDGVAARGPR